MPTPAAKPDAEVFRFDQSGALLRKVMESAAVGMALVGVDKRTIYVNRAYETMLGHAPGARLGRAAEEAIFPADRTPVMLRFDQVLRGELDEFSIECRMIHRDGHPVWVLISASLLRSDATGRPLYAIVQIINIDRQKRAEAALAESESRWSFALEAAQQGVWDHNVTNDEMFYSRTWRTMRGYGPDEYVDGDQEEWFKRLHPDDLPRIKAVIDKQDHGEDGFDTVEYRERHRDGHYIWILSRGRPVEWGADGERIRTIGTDTDITRFKQVEAQLANEKERLRVTLESIGDGVISTDADECIIFMNPMAEAMTGWLEAEAMGHPVRDVFVAKSESTGEPAVDHVAFCLASGRPSQIEDDVVLAARDGTGRGVNGTAAPVRTEDGRVIGAVLVFKDVTDSQALKRQLAHSANHDALTGLPNRAAFAAALAEARRQAIEGRRDHVLCFIDLDRFKPVNDTAGHAAGDALLQQVAQMIRRQCRAGDFAARLGGDEFVLLLCDCPAAAARQRAEAVVAAITAIDFTWNGSSYRIGASAGLAPLATAGDPLSEADSACYAAKAAGRGRVAFAGNRLAGP
jgi:diguanylate cyclase (GGDEF)-like protein/PAS domain S-box-containing protein